MNPNEQTDKSTPPMVMAGLACLACLPVILLATLPIAWFPSIRWTGWVLFTLIPISAAFFTLYLSSWHQEFSKARRISSMILSSCLIYCVDLVVVALLVGTGCLVLALTRVVGGN
jgi:hypothetical protein